MHRSRKSPFILHFFSWYIGRLLNKYFSGYQFNRVEINPDEAVLLLANHFSWWDGFLIFRLNKLLFKKQFHVLVTSQDYNRHWYLKYLGAFAAENSKKDLVETLVFAGKLLDDPNNLVLIFPQGKAYTSHISSINFEKGVMQVINSSKKKFQILFSVSLVDYYGKRKPAVNTYLKCWQAEEYMSLQLLKSEYNKYYNYAVKIQNKTEV